MGKQRIIPYDPTAPNPIGNGVFYQCLICGDKIDSTVVNAVACSCRNLVVDADAGRITGRKPEKIQIIIDK